jgi:hypothetical protein
MNFFSELLPRLCISVKASGLLDEHEELKLSKGQDMRDTHQGRSGKRTKLRKAESAEHEVLHGPPPRTICMWIKDTQKHSLTSELNLVHLC